MHLEKAPEIFTGQGLHVHRQALLRAGGLKLISIVRCHIRRRDFQYSARLDSLLISLGILERVITAIQFWFARSRDP